MLPDATNHNPDPAYLRELLDKAGLSQRALFRALGVEDRTVRYWLKGHVNIPYSAQFCLEVLSTQD